MTTFFIASIMYTGHKWSNPHNTLCVLLLLKFIISHTYLWCLNFIGYFKKLGADLVLDIKLAEDFALLESQNEFIERYKSAKESKVQKILPMLASSCPGNAIKPNNMTKLSPMSENAA